MSAAIRLDSDTIHVWHATTHRTPADTLSEDELTRVDKIRSTSDKKRFICTRTLLRKCLSLYLSIPPSDIVFAYSENGKPYLQNHALEFNLTHSKNHILIAISTTIPVGVDTEFRRPLPTLETLAKRFFSQEDYSTLLSKPTQAQKHRYFFETWTQKEAITKAKGSTLLSVLSTPQHTEWQIHNLTLRHRYQSALAYESPVPKNIQILDYHSFSK